MNKIIEDFLIDMGYKVDSGALEVIKEANDWYTAKKIKGFHEVEMINGQTYDLERMNFAKTLCEDDANLVEVVEINASENQTMNKEINDILQKNRFLTMYRKQIEQMSANGTVGAYVRLNNADIYEDGTIRNGEVAIEYCGALNIMPLNVINDEIIDCAFVGSGFEDGKPIHTIVIMEQAKGIYTATTIKLDKDGKELERQEVLIGDVKPFAILRTSVVNNLNMRGYGYPKLWSAIPNLKILDLNFTMWKRDLEKSDKLVLINDKLASRDKDGKPIPPSQAMKKVFVQVGKEKLPQENTLYQEYNPTIRIEEATKSMELALSMLSLSFGYGTKKYNFEQGRILSATEYAGERQDAMQSVNKQRAECEKYIKELVNAIIYFSNTFNGTNLATSEIKIDFDDSYIEDTASLLETMRNDALSFGIDTLTQWYLQKRYNLNDEEVNQLMVEMGAKDGTEDEE